MKSKSTTAALAFFLGTIGIHRFYLGQWVKGVLCILFCWTYIPTIISLIDTIVFIAMSEEKFNAKYNFNIPANNAKQYPIKTDQNKISKEQLKMGIEKVVEVTDKNFEGIINTNKPVLIYFWAEWCGPCKMASPIIEELANEYKEKATIGKIDVDNNPVFSAKYGVKSIPTFLILKNGRIVEKQIGAVPKSTLTQKLNPHIVKTKTDERDPDSKIIDVTAYEYKLPTQIYNNSPSYPSSNESNSAYNNYNPEELKFGNRYKEKLNLSKQEVSWLNRLWNPSNVFTSIEGCCIETIKLYLAILKELNKQLKKKETTLPKEVEALKTTVIKIYQSKNSESLYSWSSYENSYYNERTESEIYQTIFKRAENTLRGAFDHKRKISTDFPYSNIEIINQFEAKIGSHVNEIIPKLFNTINPPDEQTEIELNAQNVNRWKGKLEKLISEFTELKKDDFFSSILNLGKLNIKNQSVENIFFEASKFIAKYDKEISLKLYIYYLYHDIKSDKFDNKQLAKTIQKGLFKTPDQVKEFENIANDLIKSEDLEKALNDVAQIYAPKRKKIQLDSSAIYEVQKQHSGTVDLLNEYLKDEKENEETLVSTNEPSSEEIKLEILSKNNSTTIPSIFIDEISLNLTQTELISLFAAQGLGISFNELDTFAKSKGAFKNQLIDSINENCYEILDDVLIEEDGEGYTINEAYYKKITSK